jgi:hypothetical protein
MLNLSDLTTIYTNHRLNINLIIQRQRYNLPPHFLKRTQNKENSPCIEHIKISSKMKTDIARENK